MDLKNQMYTNSLNYRRSLDRIVEKYSKLQYQDGGGEVDLNDTSTRAIQRYINLSRATLKQLESQSPTDSRDKSFSDQDITRDSQLDVTDQDCGTYESNASHASSTQLSVEDDGTAGSGTTQLTVSSLDESQGSFSVTEPQPEDHDEELEMSLRSHSNSLVELYPSMISRIGRAWHRQHVTEAADSVVRRYRRWQQQPNRSYLNKTFTMRRTSPERMTNETVLEVMTNSPEKIQFMGTDAAPRSPLRMLTSPKDWKAKQQSPGRVRGLLKREQHQPILVMDLSEACETSIPKNISLNETFNVSQLEGSYAVSPPRPSCPPAKTSLDSVHRHKMLSLAAYSPQADRSSTNALQITDEERPDLYCSPLKQSPLKARVMSSLSRSPLSFSRSPHSVESFSGEPRSTSTFLSSPPRKPSVQRRMLYAPDSHHSFQPQLPSPQSAKAAGHYRLRRHLSFDSLPLIRISDSPKKVDEEFLKLYHKFVCQNKSSFFSGLPCRFCLRGSETSRSHSSSALAALALSPHRSLLRKRHRELSLESHPQSKRFRDDRCESSPGSKRHVNEMRRHYLYQSEHYDLSYSPSKRGLFQRFFLQRRSADRHQQT